MKLLLDQGLPRTAAGGLTVVGIDALHVGAVGMSMAEDPAILEFARQQERTVVTFDADFHTLLALSHARLPSVIRIRIEGLKADAVVALLLTVCAQCESEISQGAMLTVQEGRVRVHRLPILEKH